MALKSVCKHHQFVLNACEVQRFRRLSCFDARATTCEGCAGFPPTLAPSTDTPIEPRKRIGKHGNLPDSLCFVSHVTTSLSWTYGWHTVQKNSFSFGVRKRRETSPIHLFDLKTPQNIRPLESDMPTTFFLEPRPYVFSRGKRFGRTQRFYVERRETTSSSPPVQQAPGRKAAVEHKRRFPSFSSMLPLIICLGRGIIKL